MNAIELMTKALTEGYKVMYNGIIAWNVDGWIQTNLYGGQQELLSSFVNRFAEGDLKGTSYQIVRGAIL
jgi:hypothetical protein